MSAAGADRLIELVDELYLLFSESADYHEVGTLHGALREVSSLFLQVRARAVQLQRRYVIAVVGLTNVGKSTLLNALLGEDLAPRLNGPCTAIPVEFTGGVTRTASLRYRNSVRRETVDWNTPADLHERLKQWSAQADSGAVVAVTLPHPLLSKGLVLADTPGFGAAQFGAEEGTHEKAVRDYLQTAVSQVFWVVLGEQGIGKRETDFRDNFFAEFCDDVVVSLGEEWTANEQDRFCQRYGTQFRQRPRFHFVRALDVVRSGAVVDKTTLQNAGIAELQRQISQMASPQVREQELCSRLASLLKHWQIWNADFNTAATRRARPPWRPDSWSRWCEFERQSPAARGLQNYLQHGDFE